MLRDVVRVIRMERPLVLIARFQGNERDGHGNHQTAGLITQEAFKVAGDPGVFPEQLQQGLRPWQPLKLYMGGMRENEDWTLRVDPAVYSPWLGDSYANFARTGLSFQRSQNGGRNDPQPGPAVRLLQAARAAGRRRRERDERVRRHRHEHHGPVRDAEASGAGERAGAARRDSARGGRRDPGVQDGQSLGHGAGAGAGSGRHARSRPGSSPPIPMPSRCCSVKEQQFADAINTALGIDFTAVAQPAGVVEPTGPGRRLRAAADDGAGGPRTIVRRQAAVHQPRVGRCRGRRDRR